MTTLLLFLVISTPPISVLGFVNAFTFSQSKFQSDSFRLYGVEEGKKLIRDGMASFRKGLVEESIDLFNQAEVEEPRFRPYLWQRGLSYYYVNEFSKAREQFQTDVLVNPLDVEENVWDIASALRLNPFTFPVQDALFLPKNKRDPRPIMATVYKLFRGEATEVELALIGHNTGKASDEFYSLFYLGLFAEIRQENSKAEKYLLQSINTKYSQGFGQADYMTSVAKVHCNLRGWT